MPWSVDRGIIQSQTQALLVVVVAQGRVVVVATTTTTLKEVKVETRRVNVKI